MTDRVGRTPLPAAPRVSVIVPVHGTPDTLDIALDALSRSTYPNAEVIVIDDGSPGEAIRAGDAPDVRFIRIAHAGPAAARNRAVEMATGDVLFFTDADVEVAADTVERGVGVLVENPQVAAVFGSYTAEAGGDRGFLTRYKNYVHHFTHQIAVREAFTFWTGCGFVRRDVFREFGGFDAEQRFLSDVEFGYRLHLAGEVVWVERTIEVVHHKSYSFRSLMRSDFFGRAIPWSRIMMRHRTLRSDLNLKPANVASVPVSFAIVGAWLLGVTWHGGWFGVGVALALVLAVLNAPLLRFIRRRAGTWFAIRAYFVHAAIYLLSGIGVVAAALGARSGGR